MAIGTWKGFNQLLWPGRCDVCHTEISDSDGSLCRTCWNELLTCTAGDYCRCGRDASRYRSRKRRLAGRAGLKRSTSTGSPGPVFTWKPSSESSWPSARSRRVGNRPGAPWRRRLWRAAVFTSRVDLFVPVPLHWTRRILRGYNQAHLIAKRIRHPHARLNTDLVRVRRTHAQPQAATPAARARNVAGADSWSERNMSSTDGASVSWTTSRPAGDAERMRPRPSKRPARPRSTPWSLRWRVRRRYNARNDVENSERMRRTVCW